MPVFVPSSSDAPAGRVVNDSSAQRTVVARTELSGRWDNTTG